MSPGWISGAPVLLLVGGGHNGADTLLAGGLLAHNGCAVTAVLATEHPHPVALEEARSHGVIIHGAGYRSDEGADWDGAEAIAAVEAFLVHGGLVLDGLTGIGATGPLRSDAAALIAPLIAAGSPGRRPLRVVAVDLGIKSRTPYHLAARGARVYVVPSTVSFADIESLNPDGVFFSNGPGDPSTADREVGVLRAVLDAGIPYFGICFGHQLFGRALGYGTYKLNYGHRGINQPVKDLETGRVEITAHNHGFAVDAPVGSDSVAPFDAGRYGRITVSHVGLNDGVVEGLRALDIPAFSVQFHPEAAAGPHDGELLFDRFMSLMIAAKENR